MTSPANPPSELSVLTDMVRNLAIQVNGIQERVNTPAPAPVQEEPKYTPEELRERPDLVIENIRTHIDKAIAPIQEFRVRTERMAKYNTIKERIRNSEPHVTKLWDKIVGQLDTAIENSGVDPTYEIVSYHVSALIGSYLMRNPTALSEGNNTPPNMHIPPSGSPPANPNPEEKPLRALTENEETLRKMRGWTVKEFLDKSAEGAYTVTRGDKK